jgi:Uri superfamily endonuclease
MSYALLIHLPHPQEIEMGARGKISFEEGWYVYVGSGSESRIKRHFRDPKDKKNHWHIDYLLQKGKPVRAYCYDKEECSLAKSFKGLEQLPLGASDCRCRGHLFHGSLADIERMVLIQGPTMEFRVRG